MLLNTQKYLKQLNRFQSLNFKSEKAQGQDRWLEGQKTLLSVHESKLTQKSTKSYFDLLLL